MKIIIDTEEGTVTIGDKVIQFAENPVKQSPEIAAELAKMRGAVEYNGDVTKMIKWFYGKMQYVSWCAIAVSYICNQLNCLDAIGGKNDNVNRMRKACYEASKHGFGTYYGPNEIPSEIKKNDILFWLWSGTDMTDGSSKHVGIAEYDSKSATVYCIGGNQKDKVCTLEYNRKNLYAVYRIGG